MDMCSLKTSQTLSGSCPNIHSGTEEETLCPLPMQKENLATLKKNSWKWLSLPHGSRSPFTGRRFSWNTTSRQRRKRSPLPQLTDNEHPLASRARALSTSSVAIDDTSIPTCSTVEDSFAEIKHQLATLSQQDRYFTQKLQDLDQAIQDVRLIAYGKYCNGNHNTNNMSKRYENHPSRHHQVLHFDPKLTSRSETCIIVISDSEVVDDDDVFSS